MENVISEIKVIETEDGFRIEMKGDKEHMKSFMKEFKGHKKWHRCGRRRSGYGWGPYGFPPPMWMHMGPCWESWHDEPEAKKSGAEESQE